MKALAVAAGAGAAGFFGLTLLAGGMSSAGNVTATTSPCGPAAQPAVQPAVQPAAQVSGVPAGSVAGYSGAQLGIAAQIMQAAKDKGLDVRGQTIGVMVGMGESSLINVMHGDAVGPDSIGVFQQRANGAWGSLADRTNPYTAATNFFAALQRVPGWEAMTPTAAAHAVQRNADPFYYTKFWAPAVQVVTALAGGGVTVTETTAAGDLPCTPPAGPAPAGGGAPAGGWVNPTVGTLSSGFSPNRPNPVTGVVEAHLGQDIAAPCGTPIYAAKDGVITKAGPSSGFGDAIFEDVGGGVSLWYGHEYPAGIYVHVGDRVTAGQQIGAVGSNGQSTGCHDHFQVNVNGVAVDPLPFMAKVGVRLGSGGVV